MLAHRLRYSGDDPCHKGEEEGTPRKEECVGKAFQNQAQHRTSEEEGVAEVTPKQREEPPAILDQKGLVQPQAVPDGLQDFRWRATPEIGRGRVSRSEVQYEEEYGGHPQSQGDGGKGPLQAIH